jgi:hypothetical protein
VQFGGTRRPGRGRWSRLVLICLVAVALVAVLYHPGRHHASPPPPVTVTTVGHPILGVRSGYDLFGLTSNGIVSVEFARGQITRTVLPQREGSAPVSFIIGPRQAIVRPLDDVPGYVVPDGQPGRQLTGTLAGGGQLLPGPAQDEEWFISSNKAITLVGPTGADTSRRFAALSSQYPAESATSDGRGYVVLFNSNGRQFDATPAALRPVGALLVAVGPKNWLGLSCQRGQCRNVVIDGATGARRTLPGAGLNVVTWPWPAEPGVVAPNGSVAAVMVGSGTDGAAFDLINLSSGRTTTIPVAVAQQSSSQTLAWSPDSRWLFIIGAKGKLVAVNARTGSVQPLDIPLPALSQIAVRPG